MVRIHQKYSGEYGMTLIEMLLGTALGLLLMGLTIGFVAGTTKYYRLVNERNRLLTFAQLTKILLSDDLDAAGQAMRNPAGNRLLVLDRATRTPRPAAWVADGGKTLTVVDTSPATAGAVVAGTGPSGTAVVVSGIEFERWSGLTAGNLVFFNNPSGTPALYALTATPRKATASDVSTPSRFNFDRTTYLQIGRVPACFPIDTLTTQIEAGSAVVPVIRVARYTPGEYGLTRIEYTACTGATAVLRIGDEISPLAPGIEAAFRFRYATTGGQADAYADPRDLRGIALSLTLTDTRQKISEKINYEELVPTWLQ